jgi:hypothetical protein
MALIETDLFFKKISLAATNSFFKRLYNWKVSGVRKMKKLIFFLLLLLLGLLK